MPTFSTVVYPKRVITTRGLRFLLVEDSADDSFFIDRAMKNVPDVQLCIVKDGQEAIDYLEGRQSYADRKKFPLPDIILLDLKMPRVDGFQFLKWRREQAPDDVSLIPVVVMSGSDLEEDIREAYTLGANRYLVKSTDQDVFQKRMKLMAELWAESELPTRASR